MASRPVDRLPTAKLEGWVRVGAILTAASYGLSGAIGMLVGTDMRLILAEGVAFTFSVAAIAAIQTSRVYGSAYLVLAGIWLQIHATFALTGTLAIVPTAVLPVLVVGVGVALGSRHGFILAGSLAFTAPLAGWVISPSSVAFSPPMVHTWVVFSTVMLGSAVLVHVGLGAFGEVLSQARHIEQEKLLAEKLLNSRRMEGIGSLAGGMAHDFNNLLTVIGASAEMLDEGLAGSQRQSVQEILQAHERGAELIRRLLAFGQREIVQLRHVRISDAVSAAEPLLRRLAGERVEVDIRLETDREILVDRGQLEQVLLSLVANACDATTESGSVRITVREVSGVSVDESLSLEGDLVAIEVSDDGVGMVEEVAARAFDPFFTTKALGEGYGLGLSTVHGIVAQNRGRVFIESESGSGTKVTVLWPLPLADVAQENGEV